MGSAPTFPERETVNNRGIRAAQMRFENFHGSKFFKLTYDKKYITYKASKHSLGHLASYE